MRKKRISFCLPVLTVDTTEYLLSERKVTRYVSGTLTLPGATVSTGAHTAPMERGLSSQRSSESRNNSAQFKDHVSLDRSFPGDSLNTKPIHTKLFLDDSAVRCFILTTDSVSF